MIQTAKDKHLLDDRQLIGLGELFFYHVAGLLCGAGLQRQQHIVSFEMRDCSSSLKKQQQWQQPFPSPVELVLSCDIFGCQGACLLLSGWRQRCA